MSVGRGRGRGGGEERSQCGGEHEDFSLHERQIRQTRDHSPSLFTQILLLLHRLSAERDQTGQRERSHQRETFKTDQTNYKEIRHIRSEQEVKIRLLIIKRSDISDQNKRSRSDCSS